MRKGAIDPFYIFKTKASQSVEHQYTSFSLTEIAMSSQDFEHLGANVDHWIESKNRILKDQGDSGAPKFSHLPFIRDAQVPTFIDDAANDLSCVRQASE